MSENVYGALLCAGFGTRLRPVTEVVPKPLVPFLNTPIVTYALNRFSAAGVTDVGANLHHLADVIPPVLDRLGAAMGLTLKYVHEEDIRGTSGGIRGIWDALGSPDEGTLVVMNGDSVMDIELESVIESHRASGREVTMVVRKKAPDQPGRVGVHEGELVKLRDHRRPGHGGGEEYDFTGLHLLEASVLNRLTADPGDIITELYGPMLEADEGIGIEVVEGFWAALDNPKLLLETTRKVLERPQTFGLAPLPLALSPGVFVYNPDDISGDAQIAGPVFAGLNVKVESGARIGPNVCMDGVEVAAGAVVRNAILYGMGRIEGEWVDCVAIAGKVAPLPSTT